MTLGEPTSSDDSRAGLRHAGIEERCDDVVESNPIDSMIAPTQLGAEGYASSAVTSPANSASPAPSDWISTRLTVWGLAIAVLVLHLATNALYGFHRDELYYLDSARHLAWGFVDYPPVTPAIARLSEILFGSSVWGLRLWPSLAGAAMVVITAQIARELGGGRTARMLSAVAAAASPVLLGSNWLFETVTFDQLAWLVIFWIAARLLRTGDRRLWLALGIAAGVGLETKYTIVALLTGLISAIAMTPLRRHLRTPWPWLGLTIALSICLPNVLWQVEHGWPSVTYTVTHHSAQSSDFGPLTFLSDQIALIGPVAIPVWLAGWYWLLSGTRRPLGIAALVAFVVFLLAGKGYYIGPLHPILMAAGMCAIESWTARRGHALRTRSISTALALQAIVLLPIAMPLLPEAVMARTTLPSIRTDFADTVGWQQLVTQVAAVYASIPKAGRSATLLLTANYGEAGAINTYGPALGLPSAMSGELTYYYWKPPQLNGQVIAVGLDKSFLSGVFYGCSVVGTVSNPYGLRNQEFGAPIVVCSHSKVALNQLWPLLKSFE
jgi:4-amino-4-deoxy-L-arabinose transferase-like glycosyltransferase